MYTSLYNHSGFPNCVILHTVHPDTQKHIAEVRATKLIPKGESLTLCYLSPREQSPGRMNYMVAEQFGFEVSDREYTAAERSTTVLVDPQTVGGEGGGYVEGRGEAEAAAAATEKAKKAAAEKAKKAAGKKTHYAKAQEERIKAALFGAAAAPPAIPVGEVDEAAAPVHDAIESKEQLKVG